MKDPFEESKHSASEDPMDSRILDFDYDAIDSSGEVPIRHIQVDAACDGLRVLADFQLGSDCDRISKHTFEKIGRRVLAFWWAVNPAYFDGSPSLASLAKRTNIDDSGLSRLTADITRVFGVHNRAQAHGDGTRRK